MHRSASTSRTSEEYYMSMTTGGGGKGLSSSPGYRSSLDVDHLPTYDPLSDAAKKDGGRARFAENMVHLIPLVIIFCAMVLWFFSHPDIDMANTDDSIVARIKNMTIDGSGSWNGSSMTIGLEDLDPIDGIAMEDAGRDSDNKDNEE
ncbi:uncharacterized protein [Elaeis guineensis]|uniref:Uncharacterized protein LOC105043629 n=1 Tax=Elaeis guineensis var. tenera TaxID=51953 RepID=A0A6I9R2Z0_ELAGV|nr:uncharacterized protein LOC105043629 [Elaeis guineensis]